MKRRLQYCDVSEMSTEDAKALTDKMRKGYKVNGKIKEWTGRGRSRKEVERDVVVATYPPLELLWYQEFGSKKLIFGYMLQEECALPFCRAQVHRERRVRGNGGLLTEEEYKLCLR